MANKSRNKVRIISGRLRGRMISFPDAPGLRPTGDRLRETLFSWLQNKLPESRCLDMFAGSGALGFEAVSRGARDVVMLEKSKKVCEELRKSALQLALDNVLVCCVDSTRAGALSEINADKPDNDECKFNVVFIDPPFAQQLQQSVIKVLAESNLLADNALVCVENDKRADSCVVPDHWAMVREKLAGEVRLCLYQVEQQAAD